MESRRADPRYSHRVGIEFTVEGKVHQSHTRNLSLGGLFLETDLPLAFGTRIKLKFTVPTQKEPIEVDGEVRWALGGAAPSVGVGVRFEGLRARDVWALNKLFERPK